MSGGRFDYAQNRISDIYTEIEDYIDGHPLDEEDERCFLEDRWLEADEDKYVRKHHHTMPNKYGLSKETIKEFKKGIELLKKAQVYAQRIDYLLKSRNWLTFNLNISKEHFLWSHPNLMLSVQRLVRYLYF